MTATETARAKRDQRVGAGNTVLVWLARLGLVRWFTRRQHLTNLLESNLIGPAFPLHLLGARVRELMAVGNLAGNLALSFVALSYSGRLTITVQADADSFPDLPVLVCAMRQDWADLAAADRESGGPRG